MGKRGFQIAWIEIGGRPDVGAGHGIAGGLGNGGHAGDVIGLAQGRLQRAIDLGLGQKCREFAEREGCRAAASIEELVADPEIQAVCSRVMIINRGRAVYNEPLVAERSAAFAAVSATFRRMPDARTLETLDGVTRVLALGEGRFRIECQPGADPREAIVQAAGNGNWGLIELRAERRTLEEIFVELTSGEATSAEAMGAAA